MGTQSSIVATYMASIDVDNTITLIGALIAAPEAGLTINAETLVVQVVEEYSREKGFGFSASIPTDRSGDFNCKIRPIKSLEKSYKYARLISK